MLCEKLKDHALKIINYEKEGMIPLSKEENKSYEEHDVCHICKKSFIWMEMMKMMKMKGTEKLKIIVITPENLEGLLITITI